MVLRRERGIRMPVPDKGNIRPPVYKDMFGFTIPVDRKPPQPPEPVKTQIKIDFEGQMFDCNVIDGVAKIPDEIVQEMKKTNQKYEKTTEITIKTGYDKQNEDISAKILVKTKGGGE